jgi:hypothetical protein
MTDYPKPATPLPWRVKAPGCVINQRGGMVAAIFYDNDAPYIVNAANAFPHLIAALEVASGDLGINNTSLTYVRHALAIARWEVKPVTDAPRDETNPLGYDR